MKNSSQPECYAQHSFSLLGAVWFCALSPNHEGNHVFRLGRDGDSVTFKVRKGAEDLLVDEDGEEVSYDPLG